MKSKDMVELVGGPFCGAVVPWPDGHTEHEVRHLNSRAFYVLELGGQTATCDGWLRELRKK